MPWLLALFLVATGASQAATLFGDDGVLDITFEGPISKAINDTEKRRAYPFTLTVDGATLNVDVSVRGISRVVSCKFPPLRLDFSASDSAATPFEGQRRLKLVTHCKKSARYEQNVLEEYAAYRIFNVLSDVSFRVRLLRVQYVDSEKPDREAVRRYAFLIESKKALAERHDGSVLKTRRVTKNYLDEMQAGLAFVFQYLIGNTDWALVRAIGSELCCHNGVLVEVGGRHFYVPYDFDRSGIVNAGYAKPDPSLRIRKVTVRRYRGYCMAGNGVSNALRAVNGRRTEIDGVITALEDSTDVDLQHASAYLGSFFEAASDEAGLLREFDRRCL